MQPLIRALHTYRTLALVSGSVLLLALTAGAIFILWFHETSTEGTLQEIHAADEASVCTISAMTADAAASVTGTLYTDSNQSYITATLTYQGLEYESHYIRDTQRVYTWSISPNDEIAASTYLIPRSTTQGSVKTDIALLEQNFSDTTFQYTCEKWNEVRAELFIPPADVVFDEIPS